VILGDTDSVFFRCGDLLSLETPVNKRKSIFDEITTKINNYLGERLPDTISVQAEEFITKL
jgi:hypothetical protein